MNQLPTLLVTGASGHLGRRVVELLLQKKTAKVVAVTRHPEKLKDIRDPLLTVKHGNFDVPDALVEAFRGADRLLLVSTDALGRRAQQHREAIDAANVAGVQHLVYLSLASADRTVVALSEEHDQTEKLIHASPLSYTILRNHFYADNLLMTLPPGLARGKIYSTTGTMGAAFVTREDCARVAAAVLASRERGKKTFEVTGPKAVTYPEIARFLTQYFKRPIDFDEVGMVELKQTLNRDGFPSGLADILVSCDLAIGRGEFNATTSVVKDWTGTMPMNVAEFLARNLKL